MENVLDYAALRAYAGTDKTFYVYGAASYSAVPNGTAGFFYRDNSDTTSPDNGGTCLVITSGVNAGVRIKRHFNDEVNPEWFGLSSSASAATNTNAINAALAVGPVRLPSGTFAIGQTGATGVAFVLQTGSILTGEPRRTALVAASGTYTTFDIRGSNCRITGIDIQDTAKTAGYDYNIVCGSAGEITETIIDDQIITDSPGVFRDTGSAAGKHYRTYIGSSVGLKCLALRGPGVNFTRAFAFLRIGAASSPPNVVFDFIRPSPASFTAVSLDAGGIPGDAVGGFYIACAVLGTSGIGSTTTAQKGFVISNASDCDMHGSTADSLGGVGFTFTSCVNLNAHNIQSSLCNDGQIVFDSCRYVRGTQIVARGRKTIVGALGISGIKFLGSGYAYVFDNIQAIENTGHGVEHASTGVTELSIGSLMSRANGLKGIKTAAGGSIVIVGGLLNDNNGNVTPQNYDLGSSLHKIANVMINTATLANVTGPAAG